jgi:hypothetical protein
VKALSEINKAFVEMHKELLRRGALATQGDRRMIAAHEFRLGPSHDAVLNQDLRSRAVQRRMRRQHPSLDVQRSAALNRLKVPNAHISGDSLDALMEEAVCHRCIQQCSDDTSMQNIIIPLEVGLPLEGCPHDAIVADMKT